MSEEDLRVAVASVLWPLLIGPVQDGQFGDDVNVWSVVSYLVASFVMMMTALWRVMRGVRPELWAVAISLSFAVFAMIMIVVGYLAFTVASDADGAPLLFVNAMTALAYLTIAMAAVLRVQATSRQMKNDDLDASSTETPVHRWQIVLPLPLAGGILGLLIAMELIEWRTDYLTVTIVGLGIVFVLLAYRQIQLLHYNEQLYQQVAGAAIRDGLTGLYNHRAMHELLHSCAAQADRNDGSLAVLFLDIDRFKHYNDTYGHRQGDGLLTSISELLTNEVRKSDIVGRYGGEEFMVIAPSISPQGIWALAERLISAVEQQKYVHNGTRSSVTISIGIAMYPHDAGDPEQIVERADEAMCLAKAAGRNRTVLYCSA